MNKEDFGKAFAQLDRMEEKLLRLQTDVFSLEEKLDEVLSMGIYITLTRQSDETEH